MKVLRKLSNICLALLLMVATSGITINKHYCLGFLKDVTILHETTSCMAKMGLEEENCPMDCCEETSQQVMVDDFQKVHFKSDLNPNLKLVAVISYFLTDFSAASNNSDPSHYQNYRPPLIEHDIPVMVQSFLL